MPVAVEAERDCTKFDSVTAHWRVHSDPSGPLSSVGTLCPGALELLVKRTIIVDGRTIVDVREFYDLARWSLEQVSDIECEHTEGLFRCIACIKRLAAQGQSSIEISIGSWESIADSLEAKADRFETMVIGRKTCSSRSYFHHEVRA